MEQRILVTGSSGQLGRTIEELYSVNSIGLDFTFLSRQDLDITNKIELETYFRKNNFEYCINCAAYTNVEQAEKEPEEAYTINAEGVKSLAENCKKHSIILIHVSTDYVFDGEKETPYLVTDEPNPINEYGKSKLQGELLVQHILKEFFIIRTSWLYSKTYGKNFYKTILEKAKTEKELRITNDQNGRPTDTINLANYIVSLIVKRSKRYGVSHFSDKKTMTWFDFAKYILVENNLSEQINLVEISNYRTFARRPRNSILGLKS